MISLQDMAAQSLRRGADYPAAEWQGRWYNWEEMRQTAEEVGRILDASGSDPRSTVAMLPRCEPGMLAALVAVIARGTSIRMIHTYQSTAGVIRDLGALRPAAVIGSEKDMPQEVRAALRAQGAAGIVLTGMQAAAAAGCERSTIQAAVPPPAPEISLLTSGTTGPPKQFPMTFDMLAEHMVGLNMMGTSTVSDPTGVAPILAYLPFSNISGLYLVLPPMMHGIRIVLIDRFTLPVFLDFVRHYRPERCGVPVPAIQMILDAQVPREDLAGLKALSTGTAPLDPNLQRAMHDRYGIWVAIGYGATEFGGPVTFMTVEDLQTWGEQKLGSVGRAWAGARLRVVDPETGAILPPGREGLLEVLTPRFESGWIRSSDLVVIDEDGFVYHRGRADGAIIRGGFKLLPADIERALTLHPAVSAAAVIGVPDSRLGQVPAAVVQLRSGAPRPPIEELKHHLRQHVAATHIPVAWRFVEALPWTTMMKPDRPALKAMFEGAAIHE